MRTARISMLLCCVTLFTCATERHQEITPYKFSDKEYEKGFPRYLVPESAKFYVERNQHDAPDITCYYSKPNCASFPLPVLCEGSNSRNNIVSVIHLHRYFLQEFLDIGAGLITLEQWGVSDRAINTKECMRHYTRTQRLHDHETVIEYVLKNPPVGWNGNLIFVGVSEGGSIVTSLTITYSDYTVATINWSGAGDWSWREELWTFLDQHKDEMFDSAPWYLKLRTKLPRSFPFSITFPMTRHDYDTTMDHILKNPTYKKEFLGLTYLYHADVLTWPSVAYDIKTPYLVVTGAQDTAIIKASDEFVEKARKCSVPVTYFRIADMDHYIRKRPDVIQKSFDWLKTLLV